MTKIPSRCLLVFVCMQACAGRSIDLDRSGDASSMSAGPVGVEVIQLTDSVGSLLADEERVYWGNRSGTEQSCIFDHCAVTKTSYGSPGWPASLGEEDIFFAGWPSNEYPSGELLACPKVGCRGAPSVVINDPTAPIYFSAVAADDGYLYWSSSNDIYRCPLTGCGEVPEVVAKGEVSTFGMVVDHDEVFWAFASDVESDAQIHSAPSDGSRPPKMIASGLGPSVGTRNFAVDATNVYWLDSLSHLRSCPRAGCGDQAPVILVATDDAKQTLRVDPFGLYWLETTDLVGNWQHAQSLWVNHISIRSCPLSGCAQGADVQTLTPSKVGDYAMSSKYLYWNEPEVTSDGSQLETKQIFRAAKPQL